MSRGGGSLLEAAAAQVVVVTDQTFKTAAPEVALHAGVAGHPLVAGHGGSGDDGRGLALDVSRDING